MMTIKHNITEDRFKRINVKPDGIDVPRNFFIKEEGEEEIIEREIAITSEVTGTDRVTIEAYKEYKEINIEYIQKYKFVIVSDEGESATFDDDYVHVSVQGGRLLKPKVSKPTYAYRGLNRIKKLGYIRADEIYESWMENCKMEPEYYPLDADGFPDKVKFGNVLNNDLWQIGFEYMHDDPYLAKSLDKYGVYGIGHVYFDGINDYIDEHFIVKDK